MIIGITGRAEAGKSTAAEAIVLRGAALGYKARSYELSGYILRHCIAEGLIPPKQRQSLTKDEIALLIQVGDSVRQTDPALWAKKALADIAADEPGDSQQLVAIIPNIRRAFEADVIRAAGGVIVRVTALNKNGSEFISQTRDPNHDLETDQYLIRPDYFLQTRRGDSSLLTRFAAALLDHLLEGK